MPTNPFEQELSRSIKEQFGWKWPKLPDVPRFSGSTMRAHIERPCDYFVPLEGGRTLYLEAKKVTDPRLPFTNVEPHQVEALTTLEDRGHPAWLLVNMRLDRKRNFAWAISPRCWVEYTSESPRKSIPLSDMDIVGVRLVRVTLANKQKGWDLQPLTTLPM